MVVVTVDEELVIVQMGFPEDVDMGLMIVTVAGIGGSKL